MNRRTFRAVVLFAALAAGCFDPLYEDGAKLDSSWVMCCQGGSVTTCFCEAAASCTESSYACAAGRCASALAFCPMGTGGGAGGGAAGGGAGTGGGASGGGGAQSGGGAGGGGGLSDGGAPSDAGVVDGGIGGGGGTGGGAGGGSGGGTGGGGAVTPSYEFCCFGARVTTCQCPSTGCTNAPFTPCPGGSCVAGTRTSLCR